MEPNAPAETYRYAAFISYRHTEADRRWAKWLHSTLETYRVPKRLALEKNLPRRVGRCFRDEEELPASADLSKEIDTALEQSKFLIVVCSPNTPKSQWVNQEVLRFRQMGRHDRILALLIDGDPQNSFPPALVEIRRTITDATGLSREQVEQVEPLAADVRPTRTESHGHLGRMARLRLIACVIGVKFDDLRQREQERRNRRLAAVSVFMTILLCLMGGLALFAFNQRNVAKSEAIRANQATTRALAGEHQAEIELAEGLVSQGDTFWLANRWGEAKDAYWEAYGKFVEVHASPFRAEVALAIAHNASPPPLLTFTGHTNAVYSVAISADSRWALSGSADNTLKLWDLATGKEIRTLSGHTAAVKSVGISPDGRWALSGSDDHTLKLWDLATGKEIRTLSGHTDAIVSVAISPDGRSALSGGGHYNGTDNTLKLWDLATGKEIRTLSGHTNEVTSVAISPDGRSALSASYDDTLKLWDLATGEEIRTLSNDVFVTTVAFSPDGHSALSGSSNNTLKLWNLATGEEIRTLTEHTLCVNSVAISPDGRWALSGSGNEDGTDSTLNLWDLNTGEEIQTFTGHTWEVSSVAISPDGRSALSGSWDGTLKLWDLSSGKEIREPTRGPGIVTACNNSVALSPDGRSALSGSSDGALRLWDLATGEEIRTFSEYTSNVTAVAFSPNAHSALSGSQDGMLRLWDLATGKEIRNFVGHTDMVCSVAFSADGRSALSGSIRFDGTGAILKVWDLATGKEIRSISEYFTVAFSPDGRSVLSRSVDKTLKLWDLTTGKEIRTFTGHTAQSIGSTFSPDGLSVLSASEGGTLTLWDLATGKEIRTFVGHVGRIEGVAISPDGRSALSGSMNTLKLWDLTTGKEIRNLAVGGFSYHVTSVAFNPDGHSVLSRTVVDGRLKLWDFSRAQLYLDFEPKVSAAQAALQKNPDDAAALAVLGEWYAFRGVNHWAVEFMEKARAGGVAVNPLTLARCYWELSDDLPLGCKLTRADCLVAASREFKLALAASRDAQEKFHLQLCLDAIQTATTQPATTQPAPE